MNILKSYIHETGSALNRPGRLARFVFRAGRVRDIEVKIKRPAEPPSNPQSGR